MTITLGTPVTRPELGLPFARISSRNQCIEIATDLGAFYYFNDASNVHRARAVSVNSLTISSVSGSADIIEESTSGITETTARLNDSHFVIGWANFDLTPDFTNIKVQVCTVSPGGVTPGPKETLVTLAGLTTGPNETAIARVSDSSSVMFYMTDDSFDVVAIAFTVTGDTVTSTGTPVVVFPGFANFLTAYTLDDDQHVVLAYHNSSGVFAQVISVVGTVVTFGAQAQFTTDGSNADHRIVGMTPTRGALFFNHIVGAVNLLSLGRQFSVSGTTITPTGNAVNYGGPSDRDFNVGAVRLDGEVGAIIYQDQGGAREIVTEFTVNDSGFLGINQTTHLELVAPAHNNSIGVAPMGDNRMMVIYATDQLAVAATDFIVPPVAAETGFFILSVMPSREGVHIWCTTWENDFLQLRRLNTITMFYDRIYFLGPATFTEVSTRVRLAFVFAITDDHVLIHGSMDGPGGLTGDQHIIELDETIDDQFASIVSTWGSDLAAALHVGHLNGVDRKYFALREAALNPPQLQWNVGTTPVFDTISVLPFDAADVMTHRAMDYNSGLDQLAITARLRGVAPIAVIGNDPFASWTDITEDFPLGSDIKVAKYLAGNG